MSQTSEIKRETQAFEQIDPYTQLVKCSKPILVWDASKTKEENQVGTRADGDLKSQRVLVIECPFYHILRIKLVCCKI